MKYTIEFEMQSDVGGTVSERVYNSLACCALGRSIGKQLFLCCFVEVWIKSGRPKNT
jgi:hypothetical protein